MNDKKLNEKDELPLYVDLLQKKSERKRILTTKIIENNNKLNQENKNCNLYIKNLPLELTEEKMKEIFSEVGEVKSVKIDKYILQTKVNGKDVETFDSRGFGYVCYTNEEDAKKAIDKFHEKQLPGFENCKIPVLVSIFMPKNERKQFLSKQKEQENNFPMNMPPISYPFLYPMPPVKYQIDIIKLIIESPNILFNLSLFHKNMMLIRILNNKNQLSKIIIVVMMNQV